VLTALALIFTVITLVGLPFLPKVLIEHRDRRLTVEAIDEYRGTLPNDDTVVLTLDPEEVDLDVKWNAYWANSRAEENALRADLNDYVGWAAALEERFALDCDRIIKQFTVDAITLQAESASRRSGWVNDIDRRSDLIIQSVDGNLATLSHQLKVEVAECTATQWTKDDATALAAYIDLEEVRS
jgi:hypothetical protein